MSVEWNTTLLMDSAPARDDEVVLSGRHLHAGLDDGLQARNRSGGSSCMPGTVTGRPASSPTTTADRRRLHARIAVAENDVPARRRAATSVRSSSP